MSGPHVSSIPILILIDCEPDGREPPVDAKLPWAGFERFFDFLAARRSSLASHAGREVRFNWFWRMDPQVETIYGRPDWGRRCLRRSVRGVGTRRRQHRPACPCLAVGPAAWPLDRRLRERVLG
jgi:hypothetical protein